jgi:putative transposase
MCTSGPTPIDALLPADTGAGIDAADHGQDRCSLSRRSVQWQPPDGRVPGQRRHPDQPRSGAKTHAAHGVTGDLPTTPHDRARRAIRAISLPGGPQQVRAADQIWATDITYIPLQRGFLYLVAIVDLFSRNVLSWKLSNSLDTEFCLQALEMALSGGRKPEIFHSDQGCQFTSSDFVARLREETIKISWSGRKRCYDNILVERLWRTLKYEEVYLHAYNDGWEAEVNLARFLWRYCHVRPHSSLEGKTPQEVYTETEPCSSRPELTMSGTRTVQ